MHDGCSLSQIVNQALFTVCNIATGNEVIVPFYDRVGSTKTVERRRGRGDIFTLNRYTLIAFTVFVACRVGKKHLAFAAFASR